MSRFYRASGRKSEAVDKQALGHQRWEELANKDAQSDIAEWMREDGCRVLLDTIFFHSPYLSTLALSHPHVVHDTIVNGAQGAFDNALMEIDLSGEPDAKYITVKHQLRIAKQKVALITALADISGVWKLKKITRMLSEFAQTSLRHALDTILLTAHKRGEIVLKDPDVPAKSSGIIVLGMGKLGGYELNYSSDIDLIIFFRRGRLAYNGRHTEQHFMNKLAQDLVQIMQERTAEGYVFRTDLRLRPDPASMPPAINTEAAYYYYESVGQNWERAAMIKARPVAGDIYSGKLFMKRLTPFMWRRSLDFAAINDIQSIKRQMDSRQNAQINMPGHNVKTGIGGIREIEFLVQIYQLIWGGREIRLRAKATRNALRVLLNLGLIEKEPYKKLGDAYIFLRTLEHRLQMVADQQTHSMPEDEDAIKNIARFMGYKDVPALEQDFMHHTKAVHDIYASSFKSAEKLSTDGNLVFTGVSHDRETLLTLRRMGFTQPETVSELIMGWHHGSCRCTRTKQARELLTEMMPTLLKRLAQTANPDAALLRFNDFLKNLPAGVQLFSMFNVNPQLLELVATILGSAPTLGEHLSKSPALLDIVLYDDFYDTLPDKDTMRAQLAELTQPAESFEDHMERARQFRNEKQFQAGVHFLKQLISGAQAGAFLSDLAELTIEYVFEQTLYEFIDRYGQIDGASFSILALGKLGSREMTFTSDIDLVFVYTAQDPEARSDGEKSFSASAYYNRFAQRLLTSITSISRYGRLYEVDTRLRPSGSKGLLAVSDIALKQYFSSSAWTFEYMAFSKARPIVGTKTSRLELTNFVQSQLAKKRDKALLKTDVHDMRMRIERQFGNKNPWAVKYVRGGLVDIDFIAQYLLLRYAPDTAPPYPGSSAGIFRWLKKQQFIAPEVADELLEAEVFLSQIFQTLRLCYAERFDEEFAPMGLKRMLQHTLKHKSFEAVKETLLAIEKQVLGHYVNIIEGH